MPHARAPRGLFRVDDRKLRKVSWYTTPSFICFWLFYPLLFIYYVPNAAGVRLVLTAQKLQPRVHVSPIIMMVAVAVPSLPPPQHSPMFGQRASSHTVASFSFRTYYFWVGLSGERREGIRSENADTRERK